MGRPTEKGARSERGDDLLVHDYCEAFIAWARVSRNPEEQALVEAGCAHLKQRFEGNQSIEDLCEALGEWASEQPLMPLGSMLYDVSKSCLLARMIYAGEPLRTRPCPIHRGKWSGCPPEPCPAGCSFGWDLTGWLLDPASSTLGPAGDLHG